MLTTSKYTLPTHNLLTLENNAEKRCDNVKYYLPKLLPYGNVAATLKYTLFPQSLITCVYNIGTTLQQRKVGTDQTGTLQQRSTNVVC